MKLIINYDLIDSIRNVNEPLSPLKVARNSKRNIASIVPIWFCINSISYTIPENIGWLICQSSVYIGLEFHYRKCCGDKYFLGSSNNLRKLSSQLQYLNISTSFNLLLESKVLDKKYKVEFNKNSLPHIAENKYILVPTYNYNGDIKDTSILQEHVVGTKEYVLSLGSPKKEFKPAYSNV